MNALICLAAAIFFEAGVEPIDGKYAVAEVVMNRVEDSRYPNSVCGVVYEGHQFSFTHDGKSDKLPKNSVNVKYSVEVAKDILENGPKLGLTSTHYHATYVKPGWRHKYNLDGKIGRHIFYTNNTKYK